jgi:hypothetical protein
MTSTARPNIDNWTMIFQFTSTPIHLQVAADVTEVRCSRRMRQQPRLN